MQRDSERLAQLRCHTARPGHPYRRFFWGNLKSLWQGPKAAGVDVRQELVAYYRWVPLACVAGCSLSQQGRALVCSWACVWAFAKERGGEVQGTSLGTGHVVVLTRACMGLLTCAWTSPGQSVLVGQIAEAGICSCDECALQAALQCGAHVPGSTGG